MTCIEYIFYNAIYSIVKMAPTPVLLPGKSRGRRSLEGYSA